MPNEPSDHHFQIPAGANGDPLLGGRSPAFVGHGARVRAVHVKLRAAIESTEPVLLIGEPGTGKRTLARLLHHHSGTTTVPYTELRPETLDLDHGGSPLPAFGYLPRVETLSFETQASLRNRVGLGRLIIATELEPKTAAWHDGLDRRLLNWCTLRIELPRLDEHLEDLDVLTTKILLDIPLRQPIAGVSPDALECLRQYDWPGNVRELEQILTQASARAEGHIQLWDLPASIRMRDAAKLPSHTPYQEFSLVNAEREAIVRAMRQARGNKRKASRLLAIGKTTLYRKLALYDMK